MSEINDCENIDVGYSNGTTLEFMLGPDGKIIGRNPRYVDPFSKPTIVGNGIYQRCGCGDIVKLNKFILGSIHICG